MLKIELEEGWKDDLVPPKKRVPLPIEIVPEELKRLSEEEH